MMINVNSHWSFYSRCNSYGANVKRVEQAPTTPASEDSEEPPSKRVEQAPTAPASADSEEPPPYNWWVKSLTDWRMQADCDI